MGELESRFGHQAALLSGGASVAESWGSGGSSLSYHPAWCGLKCFHPQKSWLGLSPCPGENRLPPGVPTGLYALVIHTGMSFHPYLQVPVHSVLLLVGLRAPLLSVSLCVCSWMSL